MILNFYKKLFATLISSFLFSLSLSAESSSIFIDSAEGFNTLPSIATDAYDYLKQNKQSRRISRFIFVRHGESTSNKQKSMAGRTLDVDLSEKGILQAKETATKLYESGIALHSAYSSPSLRTRKTAEFILQLFEHVNLPQLDERLYEKFYGPYEGASEEEYAPIKRLEEIENSGPYKSFMEKFHFKAHSEMESLAEVYARTIHFIQEAAPHHQGQTVLVATHNAVMKALFTADCAKQGFDVDYSAFDLGNCSIIIVDVKNEEVALKATQGLKFREKKRAQQTPH